MIRRAGSERSRDQPEQVPGEERERGRERYRLRDRRPDVTHVRYGHRMPRLAVACGRYGHDGCRRAAAVRRRAHVHDVRRDDGRHPPRRSGRSRRRMRLLRLGRGLRSGVGRRAARRRHRGRSLGRRIRSARMRARARRTRCDAAQREQRKRHQRPMAGERASGPRTSVRLPPVPLPMTSWSRSQRPFLLFAYCSAKRTIRLFCLRINVAPGASCAGRGARRGRSHLPARAAGRRWARHRSGSPGSEPVGRRWAKKPAAERRDADAAIGGGAPSRGSVRRR